MIKKTLTTLTIAVAIIGLFGYWCYSEIVFGIDTERKLVALTYDDGPSAVDTAALLKVLAKHEVKATFFLKGQNVLAFPDSVRDIHDAGHEIANHSYTHKAMYSFSKDDMLAEVQQTNEAINKVLGFTPELFRPPFLVQGAGLKRALSELGMLSIGANANGKDWEVIDPKQIAASILDAIEPGNFILLHDGDGPNPNAHQQQSRQATVEATSLIIEELVTRGYEFMTVGDMLAIERENQD